MPLYEYSCLVTGETKEVLMSISDYDLKEIRCPIHCGKVVQATNERFRISGFKVKTEQYYPLHKAEKVFSAPANINIGKPTIIFRDPKTGRTEVAGSDYDTPPQGYIKELLSNPIERSKFEREEQRRVDLANEIITEKMKQDHSETRKNRHADIESRMGDISNDGTREFLRKAMQRKSKRKFPEKKSQVKLTVNHTDSSNLIK